MKIAVIGTGYVGLVSGVCLASKGHMVTCFDSNISTIEILNNGESPIHENGLKDLIIECEKHICFRVLDTSSERSLLDFDAIHGAIV